MCPWEHGVDLHSVIGSCGQLAGLTASKVYVVFLISRVCLTFSTIGCVSDSARLGGEACTV
jgi:hypothetical protein